VLSCRLAGGNAGASVSKAPADGVAGLARSKTGARAAEVNKLAALAWPQVIEKTAADTAGLSIVEERLLYEPADRR